MRLSNISVLFMIAHVPADYAKMAAARPQSNGKVTAAQSQSGGTAAGKQGTPLTPPRRSALCGCRAAFSRGHRPHFATILPNTSPKGVNS